MTYLDSIFSSVPTFVELSEKITSNTLPAALSGVGQIHKAHLTSSICRSLGKTALYIAADEAEAARTLDDLTAMGLRTFSYPMRDLSFFPMEGRSHEYEHTRIEALCALMNGTADAVVTVADAAMQLVLPKERLSERTMIIRPGDEIDTDRVTKALIAGGYERADSVEGAGQYSMRGCIIDIFPPDAQLPLRLELWGAEVDTISTFDTGSQRRLDPVDEVRITPSAELFIDDPADLADRLESLAKTLRGAAAPAAKARLMSEADSIRGGVIPASCDKFLPLLIPDAVTVFEYLPADAVVMVSEPTAVRERAKAFSDRMNEEIKSLLEDGVLCRGLTRYALTDSELDIYLDGRTVFLDVFPHGSYPAPLKALLSVDSRALPPWDGTVALLLEDINALLDAGTAIAVLAGSRKAAESLCGDLTAAGINAICTEQSDALEHGKVIVMPGTLSSGFEYPQAGMAVLTWGRHAGNQSRRPVKLRHKKGTEIQSLSELNNGDYVVHITHGIGLYGGVVRIPVPGEKIMRDYIKLTYAKNEIVYVPVTQLDMVSKYIGARDDSSVKLSTVGGSDWAKQKARVRKAVRDIADQLIKLYAQRMKAEGYPFDPDTDEQRDFELRFEFEETEDQLRCIREIKDDMERPVPMERLLCGDVGFGKTEVALRAAFKCVSEGRQCALLAPTTILAWQHYQTALRRFEGFPYRVEHLSRFRTPKQKQQILEDLAKGRIAFIIGTHSIIQKDVQFCDLGLAIIDEEQRFGVAHKESFKEKFAAVDQLTLSATPIPRTLNMAMSGLRDISSLEEAPQNRLPVQTYVLEYDAAVIADAIRRELRRGGQVYYLHNRVADIENTAKRLGEMIPEATIDIAHGQMTEQQISRAWKRLVDHEIDILLCTTIIESGVDVPNANTLIVENADCFGLSQLHQLRGRVGRSSRRAYAYLTFKPTRSLTEIAQKRLSAIREFTEFGSGIKIAMRDLELRGAGNILGGEQSGHLDMVGYDLYMQMLSEAVAEKKGEKPARSIENQCTVDLPVTAHIPEEYISSTPVRLDVYRMIADIRSDDDASDVVDELIDRFGEPPRPVMGLIKVAQLRNRASALGICEVKHFCGNMLFMLDGGSTENAVKMAGAMPGRAKLSFGERPCITVKPADKFSVIDNVVAVIDAFAAAVRE